MCVNELKIKINLQNSFFLIPEKISGVFFSISWEYGACCLEPNERFGCNTTVAIFFSPRSVN